MSPSVPEGGAPPPAGSLLDLPVTRLAIPLVPRRPWRLPRWPGVVVRTVIGRAFRAATCLEPGLRCRDCPHRDTCPMPAWYAPGLVGRPAVRPVVLAVDAPPGGTVRPERPWVLRLAVLGAGPVQDVVDAVFEAARGEPGGLRVPHHVAPAWGVTEGGPVLRDLRLDPVPEPLPLRRLLGPALPAAGRLRLRLRSPYRWSKQPRPSFPPTLRDLQRGMVARVRAVARSFGLAVPEAPPEPGPDTRLATADLREVRGRPLRRGGGWLGGAVGEVVVEGDLRPFAGIARLAEVLGAGHNTSAGLGRVEVEEA